MNFVPFLELPAVVQAHATCALIAIGLGPFAILRNRRDRTHKVAGYIWVFAMLGVAISALFIPSFEVAIIGHFGPIHLFVILTLFSLWKGMTAVFRGDIKAHKEWLGGLYWQGLLVAGLVNFLPGRAVNRMVFSELPGLGFVVIAIGGALLIWFRVVRPRRRGRILIELRG